ncbi:hypothetical protein I8J29_16270 [Paenibacillus sp. MWE-103]|uniref:DUF3139 domain-containing protein n=1 Tax=Paenibacillus artemisiicola TaxID=1172618 RepID=A0ABS3WCC1_9BACL|nr:hypothetical protein [Paenibacillus artemisiicola]MBO7745765.1 hypothetical protein [Paenibacillus artemisiicola]
MKPWKIVGLLVILLILGGVFYFLDTRFWIDKYKMNGDTLVFENNVYISKHSLTESDTSNLGKTIGIAVYKKRSITDYLWPDWVIEYKNEKNHNRIFVRGLMDLGNVYIKQSQ